VSEVVIEDDVEELCYFSPDADTANSESDCYITSVTNSNEIQSPQSVLRDDDDGDDREHEGTVIQSIIDRLTADVDSSPVNEGTPTDRASETNITCDLDDTDGLLPDQLQSSMDKASSSLPLYSSPVQPPHSGITNCQSNSSVVDGRNKAIQNLVDMLMADCSPVEAGRTTENSISWDLDDIYDLLQEVESSTETASSSSVSLPSTLPLYSSPVDCIQPPTVSQFNSDDSSFTSVVLDDNDTNNLMNVIHMLMTNVGSNPVPTVNEKMTTDKATETTSTWDLDDIDVGDLFEGLPSIVDPATFYNLVDEAHILEPTTQPGSSSPTDSTQPSTVSAAVSCLGNSCRSLTANHHCCHAGNCLHCCICLLSLCSSISIFYTYM